MAGEMGGFVYSKDCKLILACSLLEKQSDMKKGREGKVIIFFNNRREEKKKRLSRCSVKLE